MGYLKVECYIPEADASRLIEALNAQKLLGQGNYDYVYAATKVLGHWRPLKGANPAIGSIDTISSQPELKLEFRIDKSERALAEQIIRQNHPYEEPAINFIELVE